jgi:selenocysteine-specific elongation factor
MVGGATALDGIVLCVAANEGVMPQTREHFNIASLLGVRRGLVVLTKSDLVDDEELMLARDDVKTFVRGSFLEGSPLIEVSAIAGDGIDTVRRALADIAATPVVRAQHGRFFLPLDRAFTMRGFGQVVTGTLRGGKLSVGDTVELMPGGKRATVRALQNHNRPVETASPGQRVAVNLRHVDRSEVKRGQVLATPGSIAPTKRLDTELSLLEDAAGAVRNGTTVRLLTGTTEAMARLRLLDRRVLNPGETAMAQLNLDREIATQPSERFLIRSYSPMLTIGGGRILEVNAKRHRRYDTAVTEQLETVATGDLSLIVEQRFKRAGGHGIGLDELATELGVSAAELEKHVSACKAIGIDDDRWVDAAAYDALLVEIMSAVAGFHEKQPFKSGIDSGRLTGSLASGASPEVVRHAVRDLVEQGRLANAGEVFSVEGFDPFASLTASDRKLAAAIEQAYLDSGIEWMAPETVIGSDPAKLAVCRLLLETGRLVRLRTRDRNSEMIIHSKVLATAAQAIAEKYPIPASFALKDIRDLLGSTRKYVVPLMEHMDATGHTVRSGDLRRLREK